jgi:uncharacterized membrane protein
MLACILAYPFLVHLSILFKQPLLAAAAMVALYCSFIYKPLSARRPWAWLSLPLAIGAGLLAVQQGVELYALYLPPIVLPLALLAWWTPTLRAGHTPFVTRIATAIRGPLPPDYAAYTRRVTQLWVGVFALLTVAGVALAAGASAEIWSLFTNFLNPLLVGTVFLGEYLFRRVRFRHMQHPDFITFVREVAKAGTRPGA